jgi:hypothetical protein
MTAFPVRASFVRRMIVAPLAMTAVLLGASAAPVQAWFGDSPTPAPFDLAETAPSAVAGTAVGPVVHFSVRGSQIFDPAGKPFVPVGLMVSGRHGASPQATVGITDTMKAWGFNTARVVTCLDPRCAGQPVGSGLHVQTSDTDAIIRDLTARKAVAMLESYQVPAGSWPTPAQRVELGDWWEQMAIRYRDNPYVWFNLINEPGENPGWGQGPADPQWLDWTSYLAGRIRATGAVNPIVADGSNNGQDVQYDTLDGKFGRPDASAIISFGPELLRRYSNIIFSLHVWELWGRGTDAQNHARFDDYVNRVQAFGGALLFGEAAMSENGLEREGANIANASRAVFAFAAERKLGAIVFAIANSNFPEGLPANEKPYVLTYANIGDASQIDSLTAPTNLSKLGLQVWTYAHAIQASMPDNAQMTDPVVGRPVFTETFDGGVPGTMHAANGAGLSILGGNGGGQGLAIGGARNGDDPSLIWDAGKVLIPGNTYAISLQVRALAIVDPIHVALVGGPNPDWANNPSTNGWAWATLNNRSLTEWSQTDFVVTIPPGNTGLVTFHANRGTPYAIDNLVVTQL